VTPPPHSCGRVCPIIPGTSAARSRSSCATLCRMTSTDAAELPGKDVAGKDVPGKDVPGKDVAGKDVAGEAAGVVARAVAAERLTFFADAVIAIAITLLALELPLPEGTRNWALLHAAAEHRDEYVAFLISFTVIGAHWSGHHRVFRWVETLGGRMVALTLRWLLLLVVTPYATRVLTGEGAFETRFVFYASVQALTGVLFAMMVREVRRGRLHRPDMPQSIFGHAYLGGLSISAGFLVSIPLAFVTHYAYACWIVVPVLGRLAGLLRRVRPARGRRTQGD
jgi:uncharacterized membrane protein